MAKVTSKLQVTVPKAIADRFGIKPGHEIEWLAEGNAIRVRPERSTSRELDPKLRRALFDQMTERQRQRQKGIKPSSGPVDRGWTREELYERGGR